MRAPYEVVDVECLGGYRLCLTFADGLVSEIDLTSKVEASVGTIFEALRDEQFFAQVRVDPELGTITWPNGADLAPDTLHERALPTH